MSLKQIANFPMITCEARILPKTVDIENRTVDVVFSTGARVKRGFFSQFFEELSLEKKHVRLKRLNNGAPFLNTHLSRDLDDQLGVVVEKSASVDGKKGIAKVRFAKDEVPERMFQRVIDGILRNISVGYRIHEMEKVGEVDGIPVLRVVDWEPVELSGVPAGADDGSMFRSLQSDERNKETNPCVILGLEKRNEPNNNSSVDPTKVEPENKTVENSRKLDNDKSISEVPNMTPEEIEAQKKRDAEKLKQEKEAQEKRNAELRATATADEKQRAKDIRHAVRSAGLKDDLADQYIEKGLAIDPVRSLVIDQVAEENKKRTVNSTHIEVTTEERDIKREGLQNSLMHRAKSSVKLTDNGRQYAYFNLQRLAETCCLMAGVRTAGLSPMRMVTLAMEMRGAHASTDFPEILANVATKTLLDSFEGTPQTFSPFTRSTTAKDFKLISRTKLGDAPKLDLLPPNAEIKRGTIGEDAEKYAVDTYASILSIGRQAIIDDDLDAFSRLPELMGRAARDLESDLIYTEINANNNMNDGFPVFSVQHSNLGTAGAVSSTTLGEFRELLRTQTGLNGRLMNTKLTWLWVPTPLETVAEKELGAITPNETSKVNPFGPSGRTPLQMIVEPRLNASFGGSDTRFYGSADVGQIDMMEIARLEGEEQPVTETKDGFEVPGIDISIRHTVGVKVVEHRGLVKNDGV